jgi:hypothetical protein
MWALIRASGARRPRSAVQRFEESAAQAGRDVQLLRKSSRGFEARVSRERSLTVLVAEVTLPPGGTPPSP